MIWIIWAVATVIFGLLALGYFVIGLVSLGILLVLLVLKGIVGSVTWWWEREVRLKAERAVEYKDARAKRERERLGLKEEKGNPWDIEVEISVTYDDWGGMKDVSPGRVRLSSA